MISNRIVLSTLLLSLLSAFIPATDCVLAQEREPRESLIDIREKKPVPPEPSAPPPSRVAPTSHAVQTLPTQPSRSATNDSSEGNWRNFADPFSKARGNCPDCRDGEAKAEATAVVRHGVYVDINDPPCGDAKFNAPQVPAEVKQLASTAFYNQVGPAASFVIDLGELGLGALVQAGVNDAGSLGQILRHVTNQRQVASCTRLVVVLPKLVTITRIERGDNCPGWCGWVGEPITEELDSNLFTVNAVAKNWSHNQDRQAYLRVYYRR